MSKSYFINNIDTLLGRTFLTELIKDVNEENGDEGPSILGTYLDTSKTIRPKGVKKILKREKPRLSTKYMLETDVWIYDLLFGDPNDL